MYARILTINKFIINQLSQIILLGKISNKKNNKKHGSLHMFINNVQCKQFYQSDSKHCHRVEDTKTVSLKTIRFTI